MDTKTKTKELKVGDYIVLKTYDELFSTTDVAILSYVDILGQQLIIKEIVYSKKTQLFGVQLGGKLRYIALTKKGKEVIISPEHIK